MLVFVWMWLATGCSGDDGSDVVPSDGVEPELSGDTSDPVGSSGDTGPFDGPVLLGSSTEAPANDRQRLMKLLNLSTDEPTSAALVLDDGSTVRDVVFPGTATEHRLPVLGLPAGTHDVAYTLTGADGATLTGTVPVTIEPVDDLVLPDVTVEGDTAASEPGYTLMGVWTERDGRLAAYDATGTLVWLVELPGAPKAASIADHGGVGVLVDRVVSTRDVFGDPATTYGPDPSASVVMRDLFHHDVLLQPDGSFWSLETTSVQVDEFPNNPAQLSQFAPAIIADDLVVHYDADGTLLGEWSMVSMLDSRRVGFDSHDEGPEGFDWGHANALVLLDGSFVVSLRHQDALVAVDTDKGTVDWILANPDGWSAPLEALRLQPVGDVSWPYHSHGVKVDGDMVYVFDNGNEHRTTPYSRNPEPGAQYSRLMAYRIDAAARTVEQVWEVIDPDAMFSRAMGNIQLLPQTGHVLGTYPYQSGIDGVPNRTAGRGDHVTQILELDPTDSSVVWRMTLSSDAEEAPKGWLVDRASRVPSLYSGVATETWRTSGGG